jgi:hypothetical protein
MPADKYGSSSLPMIIDYEFSSLRKNDLIIIPLHVITFVFSLGAC